MTGGGIWIMEKAENTILFGMKGRVVGYPELQSHGFVRRKWAYLFHPDPTR